MFLRRNSVIAVDRKFIMFIMYQIVAKRLRLKLGMGNGRISVRVINML